jgi:hypothetical protein
VVAVERALEREAAVEARPRRRHGRVAVAERVAVGLEHDFPAHERSGEGARHLARDGVGLAVVDALRGADLDVHDGRGGGRGDERESEQGEGQAAEHGDEPRDTPMPLGLRAA